MALLTNALFSGCNDDDHPATVPEPEIAIVKPAEGDVTTTGVTFGIRTKDADKAAWTILESTVAAPSATDILQNGTPLAGESPYTVTADGLKAATAYTIYAAAASGDVVGEVASADVTTAGYASLLTVQEVGKNFVRYHVEVAADAAYRHLIISKQTYNSFTIGATTPESLASAVTMLLKLYGSVGSGPADYTLRDLDPNPNSPRPYDVLAGMSYVAIACPTDAADQQFTGSYQVEEFETLAPERLTAKIGVEIVNMGPESADFQCTPDAGVVCLYENIYTKAQVEAYKLTGEKELENALLTSVSPSTNLGKLSEWGSLSEKTSYVHCVIGIDAAGDRTAVVETPFETPALPEVDLTNLHFDRVVEAMLVGEIGPGVYDFYVVLSDRPMVQGEYGEYVPSVFPCHTFVCDFLSAATPDGRVAEGTYTYDYNADMKAGMLDPDYTFAPYFGESADDFREFWFESGTITIAYEGANYRIEANLTTEDGEPFTGTYVGPIDFLSDANAALQKALRRRGMPGSSVMCR